MKPFKKGLLLIFAIIFVFCIMPNVAAEAPLMSDKPQYSKEEFFSILSDAYTEKGFSYELIDAHGIEVYTQDMLDQELGNLEHLASTFSVHAVSSSVRAQANVRSMPVGFEFTSSDTITAELTQSIVGAVTFNTTAVGTVDAQNSRVIGVSWFHVTEGQGVNCAGTTISGTSYSINSPSTGKITWYTPVSVRFSWTSPNTGISFSTTKDAVIGGTFTADNYV